MTDLIKQITSDLQKKIESFEPKVEIADVGKVIEAGDGIARATGLANIKAQELVQFSNDVMGIAFNLEKDAVGIIIMGDHLRFVGDLHAPVYIAWFQSLLRFQPSFPPELANSGEKWALNWHMLFVSAFLIYFPFSKLTHAIGAFATNLVRSSE